jgi:hypothetical protein
MIEVTAAALSAHPMLHGMSADHLAVLAGSASDVAFPAGRRLFEEGSSANHFWLLQSGSVALDLHIPGRGRVRIDTVGMGRAARLVVAVRAVPVGLRRRSRQPGQGLRIRRAGGTSLLRVGTRVRARGH